MMIALRLFSRKWILGTILVLFGIAILIRLGIWQLDRLEQRRAFNSRVTEQIQQPTLKLTGSALRGDLENMEYRSVDVTGVYDYSNQVALRNQVWRDQYGIHLITPLKIYGADQVILVDRGWIPADDMDPINWKKYDDVGIVEIKGVIRRSQIKPDFGRISDPIPETGEKLFLWNLLNISQIEKQLTYKLLSIYISQSPDNSSESLPYRQELQLDLTEGPHLSYAIQWFTFAGVLAVVYFLYVRKEENKKTRLRSTKASILGNEQAQKSSGKVI